MKSFFKVAIIIVTITALIYVISAKNEGDAYVIESIVPCTEKHVRRIVFIPQMHAADYLTLNSSFNGESLMPLISERQKQIYFALIDLETKVVFSEGYIASSGSKAIDALRIARINEGAFLLGNLKGASEDISLLFRSGEIIGESFIYNRLELLYQLEKENSDKADLVSHYKNLETDLNLSEGVLKAISEMGGDNLFLDELDKFRKKLNAKKEVFNTNLQEIKAEREAKAQEMLREYPYFSGGDLKLASEGKIKILPGESSELNTQVVALFDEYKRKGLELRVKLSEFKVSKDVYELFFQEDSALNLTEVAETVGILPEYLASVKAKKDFDEGQEKRDDFLIESVARYNSSEFNVVVVFGANHELSENVQKYNKRHPERQICLSRIEWKR